MSELEIDAIGQIHITVTDIDAAVAFYGDILGMKLLFRVPEQAMAFFDCGGIRLYLGPAEGLDRPSRPLVYYRVDAIEGACAAVEERGAVLEARPHVVHRADGLELWVASLRDPEGNLVCLMEERQLAAGRGLAAG